MVSQESVGKDGLVAVKYTNKVKNQKLVGTTVRVHPVDAREYIRTGIATLVKPSPEEVNQASSDSADSQAKVDFSKFKVDQLVEMAKDAGIDNPSQLKRDDLIAALEAAGYRPKGD